MESLPPPIHNHTPAPIFSSPANGRATAGWSIETEDTPWWLLFSPVKILAPILLRRDDDDATTPFLIFWLLGVRALTTSSYPSLYISLSLSLSLARYPLSLSLPSICLNPKVLIKFSKFVHRQNSHSERYCARYRVFNIHCNMGCLSRSGKEYGTPVMYYNSAHYDYEVALVKEGYLASMADIWRT